MGGGIEGIGGERGIGREEIEGGIGGGIERGIGGVRRGIGGKIREEIEVIEGRITGIKEGLGIGGGIGRRIGGRIGEGIGRGIRGELK
ncbi:hypothetical protein HPP92_002671 [Vanilla planifolia]|uniref:Uncharacterized protein n=1 Tax=Vanilla planifolia TaxID=51239 RepID=A0A835VI84_VANPL|nr:hypothetical protein HPP92_002671 [Vanilla planifolia]